MMIKNKPCLAHKNPYGLEYSLSSPNPVSRGVSSEIEPNSSREPNRTWEGGGWQAPSHSSSTTLIMEAAFFSFLRSGIISAVSLNICVIGQLRACVGKDSSNSALIACISILYVDSVSVRSPRAWANEVGKIISRLVPRWNPRCCPCPCITAHMSTQTGNRHFASVTKKKKTANTRKMRGSNKTDVSSQHVSCGNIVTNCNRQ